MSALKKTFPEHWSDIFAAALHSIMAENSVAQDMPYWCFHNYCGLDSPLYSGEMSRLYEHISSTPESIPDFMYRFREAYHEVFPDSGLTLVGFDSTNQNTNSRGIELAEYGHPKVKENLPDINTAMFVDEMTGIPLYYEHFYGSLLDKTETPFTMEKVKDLGFSKLFLMMDRGYFSKKALDSMDEYNFAIMFIAFVALIIIESYRYFIKPVLDAVSSTTTASTIGELNKYQIQRKRDGSWMPMYAMTKKQRQILNCLDLTEGKIKTRVSRLRV